ncbi:MAG TPA: type 4a pilus biogenesis protein PilO [Candidatus Angelobacter sp.]|nr:type 4a pilus biogenesis protein PilO [Candidatus Angelobacter sp.]
MGSLNRVKTKFTLVVVLLSIVDLALIGYLFWPGSSPSSRQAQEKKLQQQEATLEHEVAPLQDLGSKLAETRVDVKKFYEQKIPSQSSEISQHLEKLVQETGVTTQGFHYAEEKPDKNDLPDVQRIGIDTAVSGEYAKVARFINALEQDKYVFIITQIALTSSEGGGVSLQIKFETFLRET